MRTGFFQGALRHLSVLPRLIFTVRGWPCLLADAMGRQNKPYLLRSQSGANCRIRPGTSDWWIFLEVFLFQIYRRADQDIREAATIIDIGANVGLFSIHAARISSQAQIHAFEPFPKNLEQLAANVQLNRESQIHPHAAAVADHANGATLYFSPGDESGCSLNDVKGQSIFVNTVQVNDLFRVCGIARCDLLKMDCEGTELAILRSAAPDTLNSIGSLIMEYHHVAEVPELIEYTSTRRLSM